MGGARSYPRTQQIKDREIKMPLYAHYGVQYAWLIDPAECMLEAYRLDTGVWVEAGRFADTDRVVAPPFESVSIDLAGRLVATHSVCFSQVGWAKPQGRSVPRNRTSF